jgi:flagellar hook assembly protein FlgD
LLGALLAAGASPAHAGDNEPSVAPGQPAAPALEALLPELLRTDMGKPYPMAAIKFGPEFWVALDADAGGQAQQNLFRTLFADGLLFGVGPYERVIGQTLADRPAAQPPQPWSAPPTLKALLQIELIEPEAQLNIEGQTVQLPRSKAGQLSPTSLLNQLAFVYFPLRTAGGAERSLLTMARSLALVVTGLAPGAVQTFGWQLAPPRLPYPPGQGHGPMFADAPPPPPGRHVDPRDRMAEALAARGASGPGFALGGGLGGGGGLPGAVGAVPPDTAPAAPEPAEASVIVGYGFEFPLARARSDVGGAYALQQALQREMASQAEARAQVDQLAETDGALTLAYGTGLTGRQEVELVDAQGETVERLASGPAPATGQALASWRWGDVAAGEHDERSALVRNAVPTPLGLQVSEAVVPLPTGGPEAEPGLAPAAPTVSDLTVTELSVAGDILQVRARLAPVLTVQTAPRPELSITITDEAGNTVKALQPKPPAPGQDYIFAWDTTDQEGRRVPDGRYVLRLTGTAASARGAARAELRYWIDVPLEMTQRRLLTLGPTAIETLAASLVEQQPGLTLIAYMAPKAGRLRATVVSHEGRVVRHLADDEVAGGPGKLMWDGLDDEGLELPDAPYIVNLELDGGPAGMWWGAVALDELPPGPGQ